MAKAKKKTKKEEVPAEASVPEEKAPKPAVLDVEGTMTKSAGMAVKGLELIVVTDKKHERYPIDPSKPVNIKISQD